MTVGPNVEFYHLIYTGMITQYDCDEISLGSTHDFYANDGYLI